MNEKKKQNYFNPTALNVSKVLQTISKTINPKVKELSDLEGA